MSSIKTKQSVMVGEVELSSEFLDDKCKYVLNRMEVLEKEASDMKLKLDDNFAAATGYKSLLMDVYNENKNKQEAE